MKINVKLTKKDADIVALKKFLPERKFNETVIKIMNAALRGEVAQIPMEFEIVSVIGNSTTKIDLSPELIEKLESKFGRGKFTTKVKMLIRRCIRANLNELRTKRWSVDRAKMFFERAVIISKLHNELTDSSQKYRIVLNDHHGALDALIYKIDEERG